MAAFVDANVFLYAAGADSPYRGPCLRILRAVAAGDLPANTSTEVLQEVLHVLTRRGSRALALRAAEDVLGLFPSMLPVTIADLRLAHALLSRHGEVSVRDAVHAATALNSGLPVMVSADRHFDALPRIRRVDPLDEAGLRELLG